MGQRLERPRLYLGQRVALVGEDEHGIEVEAPIRLSPGRTVDVVSHAQPAAARLAVVWTWSLVSLGQGGPRYRGVCRWV